MNVFSSAFRTARPRIAIIGAGAVGCALGRRFKTAGFPVDAVISRSADSAEKLAAEVGAEVSSTSVRDIPAGVEAVLICVPDSNVSAVVEDLSYVRHNWRATVVAHTSGALSADVLQPLADEGARVMSFHPLQALTLKSDEKALDGVYVGIEGDPRAVAAGIEIAVGLELRYLVLSRDAKVRYHLAASMASNYLVTLMAIVQEVAGSLNIGRNEAQNLIAPLIRGTLDNVAKASPEEVLTGPILRGDVDTIRQHGISLRQHLPHLVPVYSAMGIETVRVAVRSGRLDPALAEELLEMFQKLVTIPIPNRPPSGFQEAKHEQPAPAVA
ncbi:DUF2520 domain-containing protein [soil metagenome]